jgi:hypothetical protein
MVLSLFLAAMGEISVLGRIGIRGGILALGSLGGWSGRCGGTARRRAIGLSSGWYPWSFRGAAALAGDLVPSGPRR